MTDHQVTILRFGQKLLDMAEITGELRVVDFDLASEVAYDCECCGRSEDHFVQVEVYYANGRFNGCLRRRYDSVETLLAEVLAA